MNGFLRTVETEDAIVYTDCTYSAVALKKYRELHGTLVESGKLEGAFESDKWMGYSDVKRFGLNFTLDAAAYRSHIGKEFGIRFETMRNMLRCYALYCNGLYVYQTISCDKLRVIRDFLQKYKDKDFKMTAYGITSVVNFLAFINTPERRIREITANIRIAKETAYENRTLSPLINYLAIENEINSIYGAQPNDDVFRKWFPIYFWINITFILPLRATEMLLTPRDCIRRDFEGNVFLTVRRSKLKSGRHTVYYDVDKDYGNFSYRLPDSRTVRNIEKYQKLTEARDRRFLFEYNALMTNEMLSLKAFNHLLAMFINERVIGNPRYEFARYAAGIEEFEIVTAGDSRPIAMANLYFQDVGEDICRQLADHVHINTSSGYYTNISETIWASSVIFLQKKLNCESVEYERRLQRSAPAVVDTGGSRCVSVRRMANEEDLTDCVERGHLADCMGCEYYMPSGKELADFMNAQKKKADESAQRLIECMNRVLKTKNENASLDELFLSVQTEAVRYRIGCDISAKEKYYEWQERKNTRKTCF